MCFNFYSRSKEQEKEYNVPVGTWYPVTGWYRIRLITSKYIRYVMTDACLSLACLLFMLVLFDDNTVSIIITVYFDCCDKNANTKMG